MCVCRVAAEPVRKAQNCSSRRSRSKVSHRAAISSCRPGCPAAAPLLERTSALISSESVSGMRSRLSRVNRSFGLVPLGASYQMSVNPLGEGCLQIDRALEWCAVIRARQTILRSRHRPRQCGRSRCSLRDLNNRRNQAKQTGCRKLRTTRDRSDAPNRASTSSTRRPAQAKASGICDCEPSFQGQAWSKLHQRNLRRTFRTLEEAKLWREETIEALADPTALAPGQAFFDLAASRLAGGCQGGRGQNEVGHPVQAGSTQKLRGLHKALPCPATRTHQARRHHPHRHPGRNRLDGRRGLRPEHGSKRCPAASLDPEESTRPGGDRNQPDRAPRSPDRPQKEGPRGSARGSRRPARRPARATSA